MNKRKEENKIPAYSVAVAGVTAALIVLAILNGSSSAGYGDIVAGCMALLGFILSLAGPFRVKTTRNRVFFIVCAAICLYVGIIAVVRLALSGVGGAP